MNFPCNLTKTKTHYTYCTNIQHYKVNTMSYNATCMYTNIITPQCNSTNVWWWNLFLTLNCNAVGSYGHCLSIVAFALNGYGKHGINYVILWITTQIKWITVQIYLTFKKVRTKYLLHIRRGRVHIHIKVTSAMNKIGTYLWTLGALTLISMHE